MQGEHARESAAITGALPRPVPTSLIALHPVPNRVRYRAPPRPLSRFPPSLIALRPILYRAPPRPLSRFPASLIALRPVLSRLRGKRAHTSVTPGAARISPNAKSAGCSVACRTIATADAPRADRASSCSSMSLFAPAALIPTAMSSHVEDRWITRNGWITRKG